VRPSGSSEPTVGIGDERSNAGAHRGQIARAKSWQVALLSGISAAWLLLQLVAVEARERDLWPVMEASLFSWETRVVDDPVLTGATRGGKNMVIHARDFGLQPAQLRIWLMRRLQSLDLERGSHALALVARIWNREHADAERLVALRLRMKQTQLPLGGPSSFVTVAAWEAS
jgi:hypothetical protein